MAPCNFRTRHVVASNEKKYDTTKRTRIAANDGYAGGDDFDDDDDDDDDMGSEGFHFAGGFDLGGGTEGGGGGPEVGADGVFVDNFEGQGLLSAERRVEKISVK